MLGLGTTEIIIIAIVILVLFGAKRLPDSARALGRSMRILKAETRGLHDDEPAATTTTTATTTTPAPLPPAVHRDTQGSQTGQPAPVRDLQP